MIINAYTIYDSKALVYHRPWFELTHGAATRAFADLVNDAQTSIGRHPTDYVLYHIGTYDDARGRMIPLDPLVHVVDGAALLSIETALPFPEANPTSNGKATA